MAHKFPLVSVLVPVYNTCPFLQERFDSILNQTFQDYEVIVVDNCSNDGSWEFIQEVQKIDSRIKIFQNPDRGLYKNWNKCISLAQGKYIYIATSDDTMMPECLEKKVNALEEYPECDICHSNLIMIDEKGEKISGVWENWKANRFYGELMFKKHIRIAPLDGFLHMAVSNVYISITEFLFRSSIFSRVGIFKSDWGSFGDFEWEMRASLKCNIVHIPEYLATWRRYATQATPFNVDQLEDYKRKVEMTAQALKTIQISDYFTPQNHKEFIKLQNVYKREVFYLSLKREKTLIDFMKRLFIYFIKAPVFTIEALWFKLLFRAGFINEFKFIRKILKHAHLDNKIKILS